MWLIEYNRWRLASSEGLASSLLRCSVISDRLRVDPDWSLCNSSLPRDVNPETNRDIISVAVVPSRQKLSVQPKLKHNNVRLIRYTGSTRLWDALYECLAKEMWFKQRACVWTPNVIRKDIPEECNEMPPIQHFVGDFINLVRNYSLGKV